VDTYSSMENPLQKPLGIRVKSKSTLWYTWKCPKRGCPRKMEYTVQRMTEVNAIRHLESHANSKKRRENLDVKASLLMKEVV